MNNPYNPLPDALHCASVENTKNQDKVEHGKGMLVGLVCGIMFAKRCHYKDAVRKVTATARDRRIKINPECVPSSWREDFFKDE